MTGGDFTEIFTYSVLDAQGNESNLVTFDLNCIDIGANIPFISSGINDISTPTPQSRNITISNIGPSTYIWITIENNFSGGMGATVSASFIVSLTEFISATNPIDNSTSYSSSYLELLSGQNLNGTLSVLTTTDSAYNVYMSWSSTIGGIKTKIY